MTRIFKATLMSVLLIVIVAIGITLNLVPPTSSEIITTVQSGIINRIPEPTTMLLLGSGLLGVAGVVRKRLKSQ